MLSSDDSPDADSSTGSEARRLQTNNNNCGKGNFKVARCDLEDPNVNTGVFGGVYFKQCRNKELFIGAYVYGLEPGAHGFHIHENAVEVANCTSTFFHFNPFGVDHGSWDSSDRHVGDLQSLVATEDKIFTNLEYYDPVASLYGANSIIGRGVVVHLDADDLGLAGDF